MTISLQAPPGLPAAPRAFVRAAAAALVLSLAPTMARAQQALVVCPPADSAGCERIVQALTQATRGATEQAPAFPGGVHRHYEALRAMPVAELGRYAVVVVPSLANEPYSLLREPAVVARLGTVLRGRVAVWSGTPDRGTAASGAAGKRALIQTLARWAASDHAVTGATGLVVLQDFSDVLPPGSVPRDRTDGASFVVPGTETTRGRVDVGPPSGGDGATRGRHAAASDPASIFRRYEWLEGIAGVRVMPDTAVRTYGRVESGETDASGIAGLGELAYDNMASFGLADPATLSGDAGALQVGRAAAWGRGAGGGRGQVVLVTVDRRQAPSAPVGQEGGTLTFGGRLPVTLSLAQGAVGSNVVLSVAPAATNDPSIVAGSGFELSPAGYAFEAPVQLTLSYAALTLPPEADPSGLVIVRQIDETGSWRTLDPVTVDTGARTISVPITGTGTFAIMAPPGRPVVSAITLVPDTATLVLRETRTFTVTATAADGSPVSGQVVSWRASDGSAISIVVAAGADTTDATGQARAEVTALDGSAGTTYTVMVEVAGHQASSVLTMVAGAAATISAERGDGQSATVGTTVPVAPAVRVLDANGNPVDGATVTFAVTAGGGSLTGAVATTDSSGIAAVGGWTLGTTAGLHSDSLSATVAGLPAVAFGASATSDVAARLSIETQPSATAQSGTPFTRQPVVRLRDESGNAVTKAGVDVTAAIDSGGGTLGGTATAVTDSSGLATFTDLSITGAGGDHTISFSAAGLTGATSGTISVAAGPPAQIAITTAPSATAQAGVAFARQPVVELRDASGIPARQAGVVVTAAIDSGGGTLVGTATATTDSSGAASFVDLSVEGTAGARTISFSAPGLAGATSGSVSVGAGPAAALAFSAQPSNVVANAPITPAVQVSIVDAFGNLVAGATDVVTVAIGSNPAGGTLSGTATATAVGGTATFSNLGINLVGAGFTLVASSGTLTAATSAGFDVTHGALDHFLVEAAGGGPIGSQLAGTPFNVRVTAQDAFNNTVTSFTGTVGFTSTPSGGISAGATSGAFVAGVRSSHGITFGTSGSFTLTATRTAGTESGTSNSFGVQAQPTAVNEGPTPTSVPGDAYHALYSTSGSPKTFTLSAPGVTSNDDLGFPTATITSFGADSLGGSVTTYAAGSTVSPLPGTGRTTGSLTVNANGSITFTPPDGFTGNYVFRYRLTNARGTSDARVTIAVGARPTAVNDTYSPVLLGNVPINTATSTQFRVTQNDAGDAKKLAIVGQSNGTATLNADSTFTFRPSPGYEGSASFSYTVTNGFGTSDTATVSMTVSGMAWFIDAGAAAGGDGRRDAPFNSLASFQALNDGTGSNPATSDRIFLYSGAYTGPVQLLSQQHLVGQGAPGTFATATGLAWPADAGTQPAVGGTRPTITASEANAVALNSVSGANTLRGFDVGNVGAAGTAIHGSAFGALTVADVGINTNGRALSLTSGTLDGSFSQLRSTGGANNVYLSGVRTDAPVMLGTAADVLSGATGDAVRIDGGSGSFTYAGSITNTSSLAVNVANRSGGTVTFSGDINPAAAGRGISVAGNGGGTSIVFSGSAQRISSGTASGVTLANNTGATVSFTGGALEIATTTGSGFSATGGGTVIVDGATDASTIASAGGTALSVVNTTIGTGGLNFRSISANGGANGIVLSGTGPTAGLTVTGTGVAGSGGTIRNTTGGDGTTAGTGIYLNDTRQVSLRYMQLNDHSNFAIRGTGVAGFTMANSVVGGVNGTDAGSREASVAFDDLTGSARISNSSISGGLEDNFRVRNGSGTLDRIVFDTVTVGANSVALGNDGILLETSGSAVMNVTVRNSNFTSSRGDLFQLNVLGTARSDLVFSGNTLTNDHPNSLGGGMIIGGGGAGSDITLTYSITGNTFRDAVSSALILNKGSGAGTMTGTVESNQIGVPGVANSGSVQGSALAVQLTGGGTHSATIRGNQISQYNGHGIMLQAGENASGGIGALNATITANTISSPGAFATNGIHLNAGTASGDQNQLCLAVSGNTLAGSGASGTDFRLRQRMVTKVRLPGYAGANGDDAAVTAFVQGNNGGVAVTGTVANTVATGGGGFVGGAACSTP